MPQASSKALSAYCHDSVARENSGLTTDLLQIVEVLHAGGLAQVDAMGNVFAQHEGTDQVVCVPRLPYKPSHFVENVSLASHLLT